MRLIAPLRRRFTELFRGQLPDHDGNLIARQANEQALLDDLRGDPRFAVLVDYLDIEMRNLFSDFYGAKDEQQAVAVWTEARAYERLVKRVEGAVFAKARGEAAEAQRQTDLLKVDVERRRQVVEGVRRARQNGAHARP